MILGIGTDIVETSRIGELYNCYGERFLKKYFHSQEIRGFKIKKDLAAGISFLAKRFCVKEAFSKAVGTGIGLHVKMKDIQTVNMPSGQPIIKLWGTTKEFFDNLSQGAVVKKEKKIHLTLTDEKTTCVAFVIIEYLN